MGKRIVGGAPPPPPSTVSSTASTSDVASSKETSKAEKTRKHKTAAIPKPLPQEKKAQAKGDRYGSGLRTRAAVDMALEAQGKSKTKAASQSSSSGVGKTTGPAATSSGAASAPMTPVKVNVLANIPNTNNLKKVGDSVQDRLAFFDRMCAKAQAGIPSSKLKEGEQQLNLMVAPEWLFARHSSKKDEAYTPKQMQEITEGLQQISKKYPDMMIVGGSVSWEIPDKTDKSKSIMYNTSPVVQDGKIVHMYHKRAEGGETVVSKENKGIVKKVWGMGDPAIRGKIDHSNPDLASNSSIFTHKGMTFSMEVCADQSDRAALKDYKAAHPDGKGTDMHILVSAGMTVNPSRTPIKNGGVVVQVDGSYTESSGKGGVATVSTIARPDISIKDWDDQMLANPSMPSSFLPAATAITSSDIRDRIFKGPEPEQEQIKLFSGMTVMVPKKDK